MAKAAELALEAALSQAQRNLHQFFNWIGFLAVHYQRICMDLFEGFDDIYSLTEKDFHNLEESFAKRAPATQRIVFGQRKTKRLCALTHWIIDFHRVDKFPTINRVNQDSFCAVLFTAARHEEVRREEIKKSDAILKEASPGPLKTKCTWNEWESAFENYLSSTYGVNGVPLSYFIFLNKLSDGMTTFSDFNERVIANTPLAGAAFDVDKKRVHQLMVSFTQRQKDMYLYR